MTRSLRYAVLDAAGVKLNSIMVDDPYPEGYWPGYGRYITCEHGEAAPVPPAAVEIRAGAALFTFLSMRPAAPFSIGDAMSLESGAITLAPPPPEEPPQESQE